MLPQQFVQEASSASRTSSQCRCGSSSSTAEMPAEDCVLLGAQPPPTHPVQPRSCARHGLPLITAAARARLEAAARFLHALQPQAPCSPHLLQGTVASAGLFLYAAPPPGPLCSTCAPRASPEVGLPALRTCGCTYSRVRKRWPWTGLSTTWCVMASSVCCRGEPSPSQPATPPNALRTQACIFAFVGDCGCACVYLLEGFAGCTIHKAWTGVRQPTCLRTV